MKITTVAIKIVPSHESEFKDTITLIRSENKGWSVRLSDDTLREGLFPSEIKLAAILQEIIKDFNGGKI